MGAPTSERPRRGGIKCEFCSRTVQSAAALESHQASLHSQALKEKARRNSTTAATPAKPPNTKKVIPKVVAKDAKATEKAEPNTPTVAIVAKQTKSANNKPKSENAVEKTSLQPTTAKPEAKTANNKAAVKTKTVKTDTKSSTPRKVEYKCPKCEKAFPIQFVAQKHIQKYHCVNSKDEEVAQDSPDIIQPILMEYCKFCDEMCAYLHDCPNRSQLNSAMSHTCVGCQQLFQNSRQFDMHIPDVHGGGAESLFFLLEKEFTAWRKAMESQTECRYILMSKTNNKEVYRCSEFTDSEYISETSICPSSFFKTKFPKGIQVHLYPKHYGHEFKKYIVTDEYKSYTVTDLVSQGNRNANLSCDEDLYLQFKSLMESLIYEAAKANIDTLKTLINKAMEMDKILNESNDDDEIESFPESSSVSLKTSKKEESTVKTVQNRKRVNTLEENGKPAKKKKVVGDAKANKKSFSLSDEKDSDKILKELGRENVKVEKSVGQSPSSFNDSYKEFIDKAIKNPNPKPVKKKAVVKTKMGQFKPSLSPKKEVKRTSSGSGVVKDIVYEVREQENDCNILVLKI